MNLSYENFRSQAKGVYRIQLNVDAAFQGAAKNRNEELPCAFAVQPS